MTDEQIALARRAVACKGWRWMPGMATYTPVPYTSPHLGRILSGENDILHLWRDETIPRLRDPATLGCLLALVREAWGDPEYLWSGYAEVRRDSVMLFLVLRFDHDASGFLVERWVSSGTTEAEALVAALEAAP